jgi:hypothetical protein
MWEMYQPMLRADFKLFDEYTPSNTQVEAQAAPFASTLRLFGGQQDRRVTEAMVKVGNSRPTVAAATASPNLKLSFKFNWALSSSGQEPWLEAAGSQG